MKTKFSTFILFLLISATCFSQPNITPKPAKLLLANETTLMSDKFVIVCNFDSANQYANALYLQKQLLKKDISCKIIDSKFYTKKVPSIQLCSDNGSISSGAYQLSINGNNIIINGSSTGVFYGIQTLIQLMQDAPKTVANTILLPNLNIFDSPRFEYRGMHLDVSRHFFSVEFLKKYLDYLAAYKFNSFHWHLTDDQGWRIPIAKYPLLTSVGSERNGTIIGRYPGKGNDNIPLKESYTLEEIKEVIKYAAERHIEVIPEIEMPGHASAAIAAYPWLSCFPNKPTLIPANMISDKSIAQQKAGRVKLVQETWGIFDDVFCAGKPETFVFLKDVLSEVIDIFPSNYIHIGGDETPKTHWKQCPFCQKRMKENNLKDEHELQSWMVNNIGQFLTSKGKTLIGWDEILEGGLADNAIVMSWRGEAGGIEAAKQQHQVIMTPGKPLYFDHTQSTSEDSVTIGGLNTLEAVYNYNPVPASLPVEARPYIIGAQANMWTEYMGNPEKVEYMLFPRLAALSEVLWTQPGNKDWNNFQQRLPSLLTSLSEQKINFSKAYYDVTAVVTPTGKNNSVRLILSTKFPKINLMYQLNNSAFKTYTDPILIDKSVTISYGIFKNNKAVKLHKQLFSFNVATGKSLKLENNASSAYPGNGAFTLVDGIQNTKKLAQSTEFLGFNGNDLDVTIDLGKDMEISEVRLHSLKQQASWIYLPSEVEVYYMPYIDTTVITRHSPIESILVKVDKDSESNVIVIKGKKYCRYVRVIARNYGLIPAGQPGGGNKAWLFADEIEIE